MFVSFIRVEVGSRSRWLVKQFQHCFLFLLKVKWKFPSGGKLTLQHNIQYCHCLTCTHWLHVHLFATVGKWSTSKQGIMHTHWWMGIYIRCSWKASQCRVQEKLFKWPNPFCGTPLELTFTPCETKRDEFAKHNKTLGLHCLKFIEIGCGFFSLRWTCLEATRCVTIWGFWGVW